MQGDRSEEGRRMSIDLNLPPTSSNSSGSPGSRPSPSMNAGDNNVAESMNTVDNNATESMTDNSKRLQGELYELARRIKLHKENLKYLKTLKKQLEDSIPPLQVSLQEYTKASSSNAKSDEDSNSANVNSEEQTIKRIINHDNSAAGLLCFVKHQFNALASDYPFRDDVIGIVATLGVVADDNLSRLLSEYLGRETMLAVVCKTVEGVKALEAYNSDGSIDKAFGLHAFAASIRRPLNDRFLVRCIENIRSPYAGKFLAGDPQMRLDLPAPRLLNGETPRGFLGFAVNLITIDITNLNYILKNGRNLRETLFYSLFSSVQVYETWEDLFDAMPVIKAGAVSLDGGIMRHNDEFSFSHGDQGDFEIKFPSGSERMNLPQKYFEIENQIKKTKRETDTTVVDMQREQALLEHTMLKYKMKKKEFVRSIAQ